MAKLLPRQCNRSQDRKKPEDNNKHYSSVKCCSKFVRHLNNAGTLSSEPNKEVNNKAIAWALYMPKQDDLSELAWDEVEFVMFTSDMEAFIDSPDEEDIIITWNRDQMFSSAKLMSALEVLTAYKRADRKVKPVPAVFPKDARVNRQFFEDPMASLPTLSPNPPKFTPNGGWLS
ncbi:uncharacterized protein PHACADRAFT_29584 [Phanerochaete carnosa HHB-10118-sp]|uniref:Uncharacterized protein n=1 Tax=Phanerochaete carnosa (strain HHB-10118-sp) TaxID=650164 RepID=K5WVB5_PHACS|nr:uncharacterized protein PHACADRAFT_29584 [Phanerochaete carnosa HHB-10118-sp]EKM54362.1 hypothetical protein PHACADRAFT_29584 [Phanerochaete carnosa HHB-10118-sp]